MDLIIQRASGGSVTVSVDSNAGTISATEAAASAAAAAASASNAASSASSASSSATAAASSATSATNSATTATTQAGIATTQAATATTQAGNAATSATNSANSATTSANSATTATTQAGIATTQAGNAATSATNAANSATSAGTSATTATTQAGIATTQASNAQASATNAATSATNSANSAAASASSATAAAGSATTATTQATAAAASASAASTSATNAANSATASASSATNSANSATASLASANSSSASATNAAASATSAAASYDQFDDRYLGSKTTPPTVDNDGNPLLVGALYYNSVTNNMNVWTGTVWNAAYISAAGYAPLANPNFTGVVTENGSQIVVQTDIGTAPNEIPLNQYLGSMAYQERTAVNIGGGVATLSTATVTSIQNDTEISNIEPSLMLNFAAVEALDPRITYSRASTATYYNGVTTAKAEENLLLQSQTFDNASWVKANVTITANATAAPDGTTTADSMLENTATSGHNVTQTVTTVNGSTYTFSAFVKNNGRSFCALYIGGVNQGKFFDITAGGGGSVGGDLIGTPTSAALTYMGNDWYRVSITVVGTASSAAQIYACDTISNFTYAGDVTKGLFVWGAQLEQRSAATAYTPTTTQPITNYIPVLLTAASGVPRFDHNPISGESLGFLVEEQRTNLLLQSQTFNTTWTTSAASLIASANIAPDGTQTAFALIPTTSSAAHFVTQTGTPVAVTHTISCYAKYNGYRYFQIIAAATDQQYVNFDLLGGTITASGSAVSASSMTSVGNGWYRCSITVALGSSTLTRFLIVPAANSVWIASGLTGDGYSGVFIWGAQVEAGSFATSYIATVASQVTRAADSALMTGTNFSSWYSPGEGTTYIDYRLSGLKNNGRIFAFDDGTTNNFHGLSTGGGGSVLEYSLSTTGTVTLGTAVANANRKAAIGYSGTGISGYTETTSGTSTGVVTNLVNRLSIMGLAGGFNSNGTIKKIAYYPRRLSNAELQEMTS
jgi:hypothetical protein